MLHFVGCAESSELSSHVQPLPVTENGMAGSLCGRISEIQSAGFLPTGTAGSPPMLWKTNWKTRSCPSLRICSSDVVRRGSW